MLEGFAVPDLSQWRHLSRHPLSEIFPDMEDMQFEAMTADMKEHGYDMRQKILLYEGKVLDGWHRLRAAVITGKNPVFDNYKGTDPVGQVVRYNLTRRHLDASQRAMVAAKIVTLKSPGRPSGKTDIGGNPPISQGQAADMLNVNRDTVKQATKVTQQGTPQLQKAVQNGTISVSDASKVVNEPPKVQNQAVRDVHTGAASTANGAVQSRKRNGTTHKSDVQEDKDESTEGQMKGINSEIESFCRRVMKIVQEECPSDPWLDDMGRRDAALQKFRDACTTLRTAKCHAVCPKCEGEGCTPCRKTGRVPKATYDQLV